MINATLRRVESVSDVETVRIGSLAIAAPMLHRMKVADIINRHLPPDPQLEFTHGDVLSLLAAARFYEPCALQNVAEWANESGADLLWDIPVEKLNDDRLGRALDAFFTQRHSILAELALHVAKEFDVPLKEVHYDPTHIVFHGQYAGSRPRPGLSDEDDDDEADEPEVANDASPAVAAGEFQRPQPCLPIDDDLPPAHITRGRPMEDVPDGGRVIHAGLALAGDEHGPVPFFGHTVSGNQNGHTAVAEVWSLLHHRVKPPALTLFSDTGTYSFGHLARLQQAGSHAVCPAPWGDFRAVYDQVAAKLVWNTASYLSLEQQRRRTAKSSLPLEHYELAEVAHTLKDPEDPNGALPVRLIFVYSTSDEKTTRQQRERLLKSREARFQTLAERVLAGRYPYTSDQRIWAAVNKILGKTDLKQYLRITLQTLSAAERDALPPPKAGCVRSQYRLVVTRDEAALAAAARYDGRSLLVTTAPAEQTADALFTAYKRQAYNEHANHIFKGPLEVSPVFLKTPSRVEALVFLMMISLQLYFLLQREYRRHVPATAPAKERRVTTKTLDRWFKNVTLLVTRESGMRVIRTTRLTPRRREALSRLGLPTPQEFLRRITRTSCRDRPVSHPTSRCSDTRH